MKYNIVHTHFSSKNSSLKIEGATHLSGKRSINDLLVVLRKILWKNYNKRRKNPQQRKDKSVFKVGNQEVFLSNS